LKTPQDLKSYNIEVVQAVRDNNLALLTEYHNSNFNLSCSNQFGESILHMACRRGFYDCVKFLVEVANVNINICDDFGRTPLHDSFWTSKPNFKVCDLLLNKDPFMLLVTDIRGCTPLSYARKADFNSWCEYFERRLT